MEERPKYTVKSEKISWEGQIVSVQPRIRLLRSFNQRHHNCLGYTLRVSMIVGRGERDCLIGIGKGAQAKHSFRIGDFVSGLCQPIEDERNETVEFYKVSKLKLEKRSNPDFDPPP